jgi:polysaccharide export outer membrane protein
MQILGVIDASKAVLRARTVLAVALAAFFLVGRSFGDDSPPPTNALADYKLQPGDVIRMQIFQVPDLDREVQVSVKGEILLPLIGRLVVKDRSIRIVEQTVRALYDRDYLVNPQVNMMVTKYSSRAVNVIGAVNSPQAIEFPPNQTMTLLDAISRCGGFNRFANRKSVRLTRTSADGHSENFTINADSLIAGKNNERWELESGDVVFVPESIL